MKRNLLAALAALSLTTGSPFASGLNFGASAPRDSGQTMFTPGGPITTTGRLGQMQTTTLPGSAGQGLLMNNGNGTSTLIAPGGLMTTMPTPR